MFVIILTIIYSLLFLFIVTRYIRKTMPENWQKRFYYSLRRAFGSEQRAFKQTVNEKQGKPRKEEVLLH